VADSSTPSHTEPAIPRIPPPLTEHTIVTRLRAAGCVFAEEEARLLMSATREPGELAAMVALRAQGDPLEYVIGWAPFCGLRIAVDRGVFVPRHRSELLVTESVARARTGAVVVDMCCGSGAIGVAVANAVPGIVLHAADVDPVAVACARRNVESVGGHVHQGDLYGALPQALRGSIDVLVANVPYVPTAEIEMLPREARDHEPRISLDGGGDGLDLVRGLAAEATEWLAPSGHLLVEVSDRQVLAARTVLAAAGLKQEVAVDEELEATVLVAARSMRQTTSPR
jgi:release factor glutamine methyltransferase